MEMSLEVQLMNAQDQPSNIKREICAAIEVNFDQLFLIRSGSWDQPRRYVPPERLCFYKQPSSGCWADWGLRPGPRRSPTPTSLHAALLTNHDGICNVPWWHRADQCLFRRLILPLVANPASPQQCALHRGTERSISGDRSNIIHRPGSARDERLGHLREDLWQNMSILHSLLAIATQKIARCCLFLLHT